MSVNFFCAHRSMHICFFRPSKITAYRGEGLRKKFGTNSTLEGTAVCLCLDFSPSRRYAEKAFGTDGRKKPPCRAGPVRKNIKKWSWKNKNWKFCWAASALEPAYRSVLSAILKLGFRRAAMNLSWRRSPKIGLHSGKASKSKAKKEVTKTKKLQILLSGICFGANL